MLPQGSTTSKPVTVYSVARTPARSKSEWTIAA